MFRKIHLVPTFMLLFSLGVTHLSEGAEPAKNTDPKHIAVRDGLENCRIIFESAKQGRVAYIGGSITTATGWRAKTYALLQERFPDTEFDFINAGIGGTNSTLGAFRLERDVFHKGPVDLLFLEFAVNDGDSISPDNHPARAMEGIIRHARKLNPKIDILVQYFADKRKIAAIEAGKRPGSIELHRQVVAHYKLPELDLAAEVYRRLDAEDFLWTDFSGDSCHPNAFGHSLYADCIDDLLDSVWAQPIPANATAQAYELPEALDPLNYEHGRFLPLSQAKCIRDWAIVKDWKAPKTCNYSGAVDVLTATKPQAELELSFEGTLLAYYGIAGMDAGRIKISVDGGEETELELFDGYCSRFHRPVCHTLVHNLKPGKHVVRLRIAPEHNEKSEGYAMRILEFAAN